MIAVNTHEAKTRLSALLALVEEKHEEITICRSGKPIAKLVAIDASTVDPLGHHPELQGIEFVGQDEACAPIDREFWPQEHQ